MKTIRLKLRLVVPGGKTFGPGKAELLELIAEKGSIAGAGRTMKMSYRRAWGLVEEMNDLFLQPLVTTDRGGAERGGAQVTDLGRQVLGHYRELVTRLEKDGRQNIDFIEKSLAPSIAPLLGEAKSVMSG